MTTGRRFFREDGTEIDPFNVYEDTPPLGFVDLPEHRRRIADSYCWGFTCGAVAAVITAICGALIAAHPWM